MITYLSWSFILSNSSIRHMTLSARTSAPPSSVHSRATGSLWTAAVRPTAEAPFPVVYTARCPVFSTYLKDGKLVVQSQMMKSDWFCPYFRNWDFAVPGSPRRRTLISPVRRFMAINGRSNWFDNLLSLSAYVRYCTLAYRVASRDWRVK